MASNNSSRDSREPAAPANTPRAPRPARSAAEPAPAPTARTPNPARAVASASPDGDVYLRDESARRAAEEPRRSKRPAPDGPPRPRWQWRSGLNWLNDRRFQLFVGFTLLVAALYLAGAFVSYLFTGHADQSVVENLSGRSVRDAGAESTNLLGVLGATVSQAFLYDWFGIASFVLLPVIFFLGYRIVFRRAPVSLPWMMGLCFFLTGWISVALGYVVVARPASAAPLPEWLSGGMGFEVAAWLKAFLGAGTVLLLGLLAVGFVIGFFNVTTLSWAAAGWLDARQRRAEAREEAELEAVRRKAVHRSAVSLSGVEGPEVEASAAGTYEQEPLGINHSLNPTAAVEEEEFDDEIDEETGEVLIAAAHSASGGRLSDDDEPPLPRGRPAITPGPPTRSTGPAFAVVAPVVEAVVEAVAAAPAGLAAVGAALTPALGGIPLTVAAPLTEAAARSSAPVIAPFVTEIPGLTDDAEDGLAPAGLANYDPTLDLARYVYPTLDLLNDYGAPELQVSKEELEANKDRIVETLGHYNIGIASIKATIGPTVTLYEIIPEAGVRISKIKSLEDDIALSLAALGIRIIAPIPGKGTIGIEVPNTRKEMVSMRSVLATEKFQNAEMDLPIAFGRTITNEVFIADLARMPHLLMAGATGQGKSVGLNVILTSLLYKRHPAQLKFVLVDPKKVELSLFNKIERHFLATLPGAGEAIITDTSKVVDTLNSLCILMDQRYSLLKDAGCRNLKEYNKKFIERKLLPTKGHQFMPFIVVVIDELADLMMTAGKEVETPIARLAQLARAIGIHLVVATQRPSVNVITGIIKANFPARISFKVTAKVDSRTILDASGADQLIGQGDMLFSVGADLIRVQCAFVDTPEVDRICDFVGAQQGYPTAYELPEYVGDKGGGNDGDDFEDGDRDALFAEAAKVIVTHQQGSTSLLQRRLKLGYNRAGRLIDQLEKAGVVGPFEGSKSRDVLIPDERALEQLLNRSENGTDKAPF